MTRQIKLTIPEGVRNDFKKWEIVNTQWDKQWGIVTSVEPHTPGVFYMEMQTLNLSRWKWLRRFQIRVIKNCLT